MISDEGISQEQEEVVEEEAKQEDKYFLIRIESKGSESQEPERVYWSCNGRNFQAKRGEIIPVPEFSLEILDHALAPKYIPPEVVSEAGGIQVFSADRMVREYVRRFPYSILGPLGPNGTKEARKIIKAGKSIKQSEVASLIGMG